MTAKEQVQKKCDVMASIDRKNEKLTFGVNVVFAQCHAPFPTWIMKWFYFVPCDF